MAKPVPTLPSLLTPSRSPQNASAPVASKSSLWTALYFPRLALEALRAEVDAAPWVVVCEQRGQPLVHAAAEPARQCGVASGMALTHAYALCPVLQTETRDPAAEHVCLTALADWAGQFSAMVSPEPPALLLEIGASLRLFGGLPAMRARLRESAEALPHAVDMAIAPTPQAALLLARRGMDVAITEPEALRTMLGGLPLSVLPVTEKQAALLSRLGLRHLRDLWRLPGDGLAKRFGPDFVNYLDRLLGRAPEPRPAHRAAPGFSARWPFPLETDNTCFILHALEQLLAKLARFMRGRDLALDQLAVEFVHAGKQTSGFTLGMRRPCRDAAHILALLRERLDRERLAAPVLEVALLADRFQPFMPDNPTLLGEDAASGDDARQRLLDQLQNRLGVAAVTGLRQVDEHRPEHAWRHGLSRQADGVAWRPLWLLPQPSLLPDTAGLALLSEPERIESGWWDGRDVRRDYYQARDRHGRRLWLFRDLRDGRWYLHGLFG